MHASLRVLDCLDLPIDWDYVPSGRDLAELCTAEREAFVHGQIDASDTVLFGATNGT